MTDKDRAYLQRMLVFSRRIQRRVYNTTAKEFLMDENIGLRTPRLQPINRPKGGKLAFILCHDIILHAACVQI